MSFKISYEPDNFIFKFLHMSYISIGLSGRSGSGKSTVARYLTEKYDYKVCYPGGKVRFVANELFGNDSKPTLNKISHTLRKLRPGIWMELALEDLELGKDLIVVDGVRYPEDFNKLKAMNFLMVYVQSSNDVLEMRLKNREGKKTFHQLSLSYEENALSGFKFDLIVKNNFDDLTALYAQIDKMMLKCSH